MLKNQLGDFHPWPELYQEWPDVVHFQIKPPYETCLHSWCCDMDGQSEAGETALSSIRAARCHGSVTNSNVLPIMRRLGSISCGLPADADLVSPNRFNKSITSRSSLYGSTLTPGTWLVGKTISSSCSNRSTEELPMRSGSSIGGTNTRRRASISALISMSDNGIIINNHCAGVLSILSRR